MTQFAFYSKAVHGQTPSKTRTITNKRAGRTVSANFIGNVLDDKPAVLEGGKLKPIPSADTYQYIGPMKPEAWQLLDCGRTELSAMNRSANEDARRNPTPEPMIAKKHHWAGKNVRMHGFR